MTSNPLNLRFTYVPDQIDPRRVLTIARQKLSEHVFIVAWAVNNPVDQFVKAEGRKLTEQRIIDGDRVRVDVPEGKNVIETILEVISNSYSRPAKYIARDELDWIREEEEFHNHVCNCEEDYLDWMKLLNVLK